MKIYADYIKKLTSFNASFIFGILLFSIILHTDVFSQSYANPAPVPLLTAETYGVLAYSGITGSANVHGDIGTSTASIDVTIIPTGTNWGVGDPHTLQAQTDLAAALSNVNDHDARPTDFTIPSDLLGGLTLYKGIYDGGALALTGTLTLSGSASDVFIIRAASSLTINSGSTVSLTGGAVWSNVFWYVGSSGTSLSEVTFNGIILAVTSITVNASAASINGKLLANGGAVTVNSDVLPVELTSFTAEINNGAILLNWQTATEVNNYGFEIERASFRQNETTPLQEWVKVGFVEGYGNSNSPKEYSYIDESAPNSKIQYRLKQVDTDGSFSYSETVEVEIENIPTESALYQNYPNPFNPITTIKFSIPGVEDEYIRPQQNVTLKIYDILGNEVTTLVNEQKSPGNYEVQWNANGFTSGVYFYRLQAGEFTSVRKLILLR